MIVTAHQPNYLPGISVIEKIVRSDAVIWLDEVQYSKGGWTNRNRLPNGAWLTVPVVKATDGFPINRVQIARKGWQRDHVTNLLYAHGSNDLVLELCEEILRPYGLLVGLNLALLRPLLNAAGAYIHWHFQSHLDGGHAVRAVSDSARSLLPISERLAMMVAELGGTTYLSGPSGRDYLNETPFLERGILVDYFDFIGSNPCSVKVLADRLTRHDAGATA